MWQACRVVMSPALGWAAEDATPALTMRTNGVKGWAVPQEERLLCSAAKNAQSAIP